MELTIENQMKIANSVLARAEAIDPACIIAGGAPRDWKLGKTAKDLDLFVYGRKDLHFPFLEKQLKAAGFEILDCKTGEKIPENYKRNPYLLRVYNIANEGMPVQIMFMSEPTFKSVVDVFALSICKAWYKNGKLCVDKDFKLSEKHKVIFKTASVYNNEDSYLKRIQSYFPDYKYFESKEKALDYILDNV